ncbi:hypothetical protein P4U23_01400 [Aeribacillus composti]|uniref:hypothetical protein n=1 Tax=Aeribacillus composti TaxID=1868734 RepID=UPI002E224E74|nr:hypothetical protein [Aeribacillus composti]
MKNPTLHFWQKSLSDLIRQLWQEKIGNNDFSLQRFAFCKPHPFRTFQNPLLGSIACNHPHSFVITPISNTLKLLLVGFLCAFLFLELKKYVNSINKLKDNCFYLCI